MSPPHYRRELSYELGNVDDAAVNAWAAVRDRVEMMAAPLIGRAVDSSLGLIVHSRTARRMIEDNFARRAAKRHRAVSDIAVIPQPMPLDEARLPQDTRAEFGLSVDGVLFGSLGLIDPTKEPTLAVRAFARVLDVIPQARLVFVGERPNDFGLDELMRDLGVAGQVFFFGAG